VGSTGSTPVHGAGFQGGIRLVAPLAHPDQRAGVLSVLFMISYVGLGIPAIAAGVSVVHGGNLIATSYVYGAAVIALAAFATVNLMRLHTDPPSPTEVSMIDSRPRKTPGPSHPIALQRSSSRVVVRSGATVVAETSRALEMRESSYAVVYYIPLDDVDLALLRRSEHHTWCPFKGEASYYDIVDTDGADVATAVWYYAEPFPAVAEIQGHVAFYTDKVSLTATPDDVNVR
jgi:uncharacterized protein (DUF427 family)